MSSIPHSATIVDSVTCNGCAKLISLKDVLQWGLGDQASGYQCLECRVLFEKARDAMQDGIGAVMSDRPKEEIRCRVCQKTYEELYWLTQGKCRWFCQMKDGEMALMCGPCSDEYAKKADLYRGTHYEHVAKLRGNK
jgi:hypothetical protein